MKDNKRNKLDKNETKFCPKKDKDEKRKLMNKIIRTKLPVKTIHPNRSGIENIRVPAKLDLIALKMPYWLYAMSSGENQVAIKNGIEIRIILVKIGKYFSLISAYESISGVISPSA